jgi:uncharacterized protein YggE
VLHSQALHEAALQAKSKSEALASALNLKILRTLAVEETAEPAGPPDVSVTGGLDPTGAAPTAVQSGSFGVSANVQLTVEVAAR